MLDSKQLAERAALAILNGRRVLVAVPETERAATADLCWSTALRRVPNEAVLSRPMDRHRSLIEVFGRDEVLSGAVRFVSDSAQARGYEFDEFLYHQDTPAATIEALLPLLGRGLELA